MKIKELQVQMSFVQDSTRQFKAEVRNTAVMGPWPQIDFTDDRDGCLFTATVHRKPAEELKLLDISSECGLLPDMMPGKSRESVGNDPECLPGKTFSDHPGAGCIDWHYRAIGAAKHSEAAKRRIAAPCRREKGRPLGGDLVIGFREQFTLQAALQAAEQVTWQVKNIIQTKRKNR
jgi:hypothetical protein